MLRSLFHLPAGLIICFAQIRPFLRFLETSLTVPIILSSEADISSSWVKFCARHQQRACCSPCWRAGFWFCGVGCFFFSFCLKINLKHLSIQVNGSTMSFCDPFGTNSFFPNMTWCFEGEKYKVCSKQTRRESCLVLGGCCFRTPKSHMNAGAKINLCSMTQGRRGLMSYQVFVSAEGPVHTLVVVWYWPNTRCPWKSFIHSLL